MGGGLASGVQPDDPGSLPSGPGLSVQVPGHRLLLHRAHEHDPVDVPATQRGQRRRRGGRRRAAELRSHGEVGDEGPFGDLHVEADALSLGGRVEHRAPDGGVDEARRDPALHPVALDGDVISTDGLARPPWGEGGDQGFLIDSALSLFIILRLDRLILA